MNPRPKIHHFIPHWIGPIEGYTVNVVRRAYPLLAAEHEFEDLLQEAYIKYLTCVRVYRGRVTNGAWFMALYKRALNNHLRSLLHRHTRYMLLEYGDDANFPEASVNGDVVEVLQILNTLPLDLVDVARSLMAGVRKGVPLKKIERLHTFILQGSESTTG